MIITKHFRVLAPCFEQLRKAEKAAHHLMLLTGIWTHLQKPAKNAVKMRITFVICGEDNPNLSFTGCNRDAGSASRAAQNRNAQPRVTQANSGAGAVGS
jgi:hypothetical protein